MHYFLLESSIDEHGVIYLETMKYMVYLYQLLEDGNNQDNCTVVSLVETAIAHFINELHFITEVFLQSDNDKCYQTSFTLLVLYILNIKYRDEFYILEFIHTETQDGKIILDVHSTCAIRFIFHFMRTR